MNVLDELREAIILSVVMSNQRATSATIDREFDAFERYHQGLIDRTVRCRDCGQPTMDSGDGFTICPACAKEATPS